MRNRKIQAPKGVVKHNHEHGIEIEDHNSPFDRELHAAGLKSSLLLNSIESQDQPLDPSNGINVSKKGKVYNDEGGNGGFVSENKSNFELAYDF